MVNAFLCISYQHYIYLLDYAVNSLKTFESKTIITQMYLIRLHHQMTLQHRSYHVYYVSAEIYQRLRYRRPPRTDAVHASLSPGQLNIKYYLQ